MTDILSQTVLEYKGPVSFNTISGLLTRLKENTTGEKVNTYKRLLTITIEVLENCYRYVENTGELKSFQQDHPSYITIRKEVSSFRITSGNTIRKSDMGIISSKLDQVNALDETGLRELYKQTIANGKFSEVGGAGLGFIEIAKASGEKLDYGFEHITGDIYYYTIKLEVKP